MLVDLRPMLVSSGPLRPDSERYAFEVKWDGFRGLVRAAPGSVSITSRNGNDMAHRYPELHALATAVSDEAVLDGEIVALGEDGNPDFAALGFRDRSRATYRPDRLAVPPRPSLEELGHDQALPAAFVRAPGMASSRGVARGSYRNPTDCGPGRSLSRPTSSISSGAPRAAFVTRRSWNGGSHSTSELYRS